MNFCLGFNIGVLSSKIGLLRIALVFADLVVFLGISSPVLKLAHVLLEMLPILYQLSFSEFIITFNTTLFYNSFQFDYSIVVHF